MKKAKMLGVGAALVVLLGFLVGCASVPPASFTPGTYRGYAMGGHGPIAVEVVFSQASIVSITVVAQGEDPDYAAPAFNAMPGRIIAAQSLAVDTVAGATATSRAIIHAVSDAAHQAGVNPMSLWR